MYICLYVYMYTCIYVYMYMYIYIIMSNSETFLLPICLLFIGETGFITFLNNEYVISRQNPIPNWWLSTFVVDSMIWSVPQIL